MECEMNEWMKWVIPDISKACFAFLLKGPVDQAEYSFEM